MSIPHELTAQTLPSVDQDEIADGTTGLASIQRCVAPGAEQPYDYFLYVPHSLTGPARVLVTVHGISRNAQEHLKRFANLAERHQVVMVAPLFPESRFPDYQRLGRMGRGEQAAPALSAILADVARRALVRQGKVWMFGYSGGAQFVHRYAMAFPEQVERYAVAAAGWYTFPDAGERYPLGIRASRSQGELRFEPERFLRVPALVVVGENDNMQNGQMRETERVVALQGESRLERGQRWIARMQQAALEHGLDTTFEFRLLPRSRHLFRQCMRRGDMGKNVFRFLFGTDA